MFPYVVLYTADNSVVEKYFPDCKNATTYAKTLETALEAGEASDIMLQLYGLMAWKYTRCITADSTHYYDWRLYSDMGFAY